MDRDLLIYVENISPSSNEESLVNYLQKWASTVEVYFLREKQCTKRSLAGFIRVTNEADLQKVLDRNQQNYRGKRLFMLRTDQPQFFQADQTIIVRNINAKISEENLCEHFEECGAITHVQVRTDDFAYIGFQDKTGAKYAMAKNNMPLKNTNLKIQLLTRNVEIMIVNLDTLQKNMHQLYRQLCMPIQPKPVVSQQQADNAQQEPRQVEQKTQQQEEQPQQQQQNYSQQNQQRQQHQNRQPQQQNKQHQQQQQNRPPQQHQQQQSRPQQQHQQQQNRPQQQQQQQNRPQQQQQQQQNRPQQQQQQQQNRPQQQHQQQQQHQNRQPQQQNKQHQQQQNGHQQSNQPRVNVWQSNVLNQAPLPQRVRQQQQEPPKSEAQPHPVASSALPVNGSNGSKPNEEPDVIVLDPSLPETADADAPAIADEADSDVQFVTGHDPDLPPIPSEYQPKPDDVMRPVKASEIMMIDNEVKDEADRRAVWVNNIPAETRRIELIEYFEQFGSVLNCKVKPSTCCFFTKWAKVTFISEQVAEKAAEYFLHPYRERYLFVLPCKKCVEENPDRTFVIDYLSKYTTYEEVAAAFKHVGEVNYLVRLYGNSFKSRIFFANDVNPEEVLAVKSVNGLPINVERFTKGMALKNPKGKLKELIASREKKDDEKLARLERINEINQAELSAPCIPRLYTNNDPVKHPVEVIIENVAKGTSNKQIYGLFKTIGQPISIRREPEPYDRRVERIFVGFPTLSKALKAAELSPETTLKGHNLFIYTAWTTATKSQNNTLLLKLAETVTIQAIYNEMSRFGRVRYVQMDGDKQATVVFFGLDSKPVESARSATTIGNVKILSKVRLNGPSTAIKSDGPIVIDDEVEIVAVEPADTSAGAKPVSNVPSNDDWDMEEQTNKERLSKQQQKQQPRGSQNPRQKFRNPFSEQQQQRQSRRDGPYQQQQQQQQQQQGNPWNNQNFRMDDSPRRQFDRNDQGPWQNQRRQDDQFDRFNQERNMNQFERGGLRPLMDDGDFNRGAMQFDNPPLDRFDQRQYPNQFSPPRHRSPFEQNFRNWNEGTRGRESPLNIPPNISDDDIDSYIMQKQLAIERRLEQLDKQLTTSGDSRRSRNSDDVRRRRDEVVFGDNGDVHYVPNPAARFRDGRRNANRNRQNGRGRAVPMASRRTHDPFDDIEQINVPAGFDDRPPSPKRSRNYQGEDDFDAERFNAAWC
ncbi:uncharacterized protein LOC128742837 [Sabethes cyaneus]|uniref:uncharacterized protein LOC128742837 n=1 Tax=Sabethes cyaneus TaxID=53552 RepID=UPI00237DC166|nr:uncharacterized protein LOC128742837 [Sabethes cyaneus]